MLSIKKLSRFLPRFARACAHLKASWYDIGFDQGWSCPDCGKLWPDGQRPEGRTREDERRA